MKNPLLFLSVLAFFNLNVALAQPDTLIGIIDGQLIKINQNDAGIAQHLTINGTPANYEGLRLSYNNTDSCFYTISNTTQPAGTDGIAKIDLNGNWTDLGPLTVPGETVYFMESVTYNPFNGLMYVTASLNGQQQTDWWSESLVQVDIGTMTGTVVGTFQHTGTVYEPECDLITFGPNNKMYYNDTEPGGPEFKYFLEQDLDFLSPPTLIHEEYFTSGGVNGMSYRDEKLYFCVDRDLRVVDLVSGIHTNLVTMFSPSDFNGQALRGLTWIGRKNEVNEEPTEIVETPLLEFNVYPNPSTGVFTIEIPHGVAYKAQLFSIDGRLIQSYILNQHINIIEVDQGVGIYILESVYGNLSEQIRLVVQ